ncbi:MAG: hypothetical protein K8U57_18065 [Planctomycetes bacterium]|nr:hypothetical protein [Planctomycetota bacterium]
MPRTPWYARLFGSATKPIRNHRGVRLDALQLEDRYAPAVLSADGTTLNVLLDTAGEQLTLTATASGISLGTSATFSGLATGSGPVTFGTPYTAVRVTDSAAGTSVAFGDSGTNPYTQSVEVALTQVSAGVTFAGTSDFGNNNLDVAADYEVKVLLAAAVKASTGDISLDGNYTAQTGVGDFDGLDVRGNISTSDGSISLAGQGGQNTTGSLNGVAIAAGAVVSASGDGDVSVTGIGGDGGKFNYGVVVDGTGTAIKAVNGTVTLTGTGGTGDEGRHYGVSLQLEAVVSSSGGEVNIDGTGGTGDGGYNSGVIVAEGAIASAGGSVGIVGSGGTGDGGANYGVDVFNGGLVTSVGATATVTVTGTGGGGTGGGQGDQGVFVDHATVTSGGGDVVVTGTGGTGLMGNDNGVTLNTDGVVTAGGLGSVTVTGTGGSQTSGFNVGVWVGGTLTSGGGNVSVNGTGGAALSGNFGVYVTVGSITSGGSGTVTVVGTGGVTSGLEGGSADGPTGGFFGGPTYGANLGVGICDDGTITSGGDGDVTVTGTGGGAGAEGFTSAGANTGVGVLRGTITSGGGNVTVTGTGGDANPTDNMVIRLYTGKSDGVSVYASSVITSGGGGVTITGTGGDGSFCEGVNIDGMVSAGESGSVTITGTGGLGADCCGVAITGTVTAAEIGSVLMTGTGGGSPGIGANEIGVIIQLAGGSGLGISTSGSVDVTITGTTPLDFDGNGVFIGSPLDIIATNAFGVYGVSTSGSGSIFVTGTGGGGDSGVVLSIDALMAPGGDITVTGVTRGKFVGDNRHGVFLRLGTISSNDGDISITGTVLDGGGKSNDGVHAEMGSRVTSFTGDVTVSGTGGTGADSQGVDMVGGLFRSIQGNVTITGTGQGGTGSNSGLLIGSQLIAAGILTISGTAGFDTTAVVLESGRLVGLLGVNITTDSLDIHSLTAGPLSSIRGGATGNGTVTIHPQTAGTIIDLGGADVLLSEHSGPVAHGTLGLSAEELATITAGVLVVGDKITTASITVSEPVDLSTTPEVHLTSFGPVREGVNGSIKVAKLAVETQTESVTLEAESNQIGTIAAVVGGPGNGLTLNGGQSVAIGTVGDLSGIEASGLVKVTAKAIDLTSYIPSKTMVVLSATQQLFLAIGIESVSLVTGGGGSNTSTDTIRPTVTISAPSATVTTSGSITYTVTYADTNFNGSTLLASNVMLNRTGTAFGTVTVSPGSGATRTVTISNITGTGTLGISLVAGTASDRAGNLAPAAGASETFNVIKVSPPPPPVVALAVGGSDGTVRMLTKTGSLVTTVTPITGYTGLVSVALGDFNSDTVLDLAVAPANPAGQSGLTTDEAGKVFIYDGAALVKGTLTLIHTFTSFASSSSSTGAYTNGLNIATGDVNGDGHVDLVAGTRGGNGTTAGRIEVGRLVVIDGTSPAGTNIVIGNIQMPFSAGYQKGVIVAAGNVDGVGGDEIAVTRGGPVASPNPAVQTIKVKVLQLQGNALTELHLGADGSTAFAPFGSLTGAASAINRDGRVTFVDPDGDGKDELVFTALDPLTNPSNEQVRVAVFDVDTTTGLATAVSTGTGASKSYLVGTNVKDHAIASVDLAGNGSRELLLLTENGASNVPSGIIYLAPTSESILPGGFILSITTGGVSIDGD